MRLEIQAGPARARVPADHFLEYEAFRQLYERPYLEYARLRIGDAERAAHAVAQAFNALSSGWAGMLRSASLAAAAWTVLDTAVVSISDECGSSWARRSCHLTAGQADAVRLHHYLGFTVPETAALLGVDDHTVDAALGSAARSVCPARRCRLGPA
ncbi:sigma-70 region 4 domain-containing protein [Streptomyces sp. CB04723]|uniref:sigma-70 region 4 domain-containing protein n=1 Tax=Streptomyces TaxID=1883 RepID=UPI0015C416A7|nr:sigma-70 region 4 domain-containing protein [Streptomyces sp. CB04723]QLG31342.1 sigma-70 region 4 domain-containing protein [Streptomyces sp. CB04723]